MVNQPQGHSHPHVCVLLLPGEPKLTSVIFTRLASWRVPRSRSWSEHVWQLSFTPSIHLMQMRWVYLSALLHLAETEAQITNNMWNNTQSQKEWLTGLNSSLLSERITMRSHTLETASWLFQITTASPTGQWRGTARRGRWSREQERIKFGVYCQRFIAESHALMHCHQEEGFSILCAEGDSVKEVV